MKRILSILLLLVAAYLGYQQQSSPGAANRLPSAASAKRENGVVERAFAERRSNLQIEVDGTVTKVLADDNDGARHQRFVVALPSGHTLLVAHNIDLAQRAPVQRGDAVSIYGEYEWNTQGGVVHWTHRDPNGRHVAGWIKHNERTYQ